MKIKKFQQLSKVIAFLFALAICFLVAMFLITYVPRVLGWEYSPEVLYKDDGLQLFSASCREHTQLQENQASLVVFPFIAAVLMFACYTGFNFFTALAEGESPFQEKFVKILHRLGFILMVFGILMPIAYSMVITLMMPKGYYVSFAISNKFFSGLILFVIAEVFNYGVNLQNLADDTI